MKKILFPILMLLLVVSCTKTDIKSYEDCVNAGYPVLESYPQQCKTPDGKSFTQVIDNGLEPEPNPFLDCTLEQKNAQACTYDYTPVCGDNGITYGNACGACASKQIDSYMPGECLQEKVICSEEQKKATACTADYSPVCGEIVLNTGKTVYQTFGNACAACAAMKVIGYVVGECESDNIRYISTDEEECSRMGIWQCEDGMNIFSDETGCGCQIAANEPIIGGERDEHGCLGPAGYSWDSEIGACTRAWELDESQVKAAKIVIAPLSYYVTVVEVITLKCQGCFYVNLQRNDNQEMQTIKITDWKISNLEGGILSGHVSIGPLCPVERDPPDPNCLPTQEIYDAWPLAVYGKEMSKIADLSVDENGNFNIELSPGDYIIDLEEQPGFGSSNLPYEISVSLGKTIDVMLDIDTGIR
ncbi:MAG: Kazal-type serine protease inhibitor [archaeon]